MRTAPYRRPNRSLIALTLAVGLLLAACGKPPTPAPETQAGLFITPEIVNVQANEEVEFTFEARGLPAGVSSVVFEWNLGDGTAASTGSEEVTVSGRNASHRITYTYATDGAFGVWVSVADPEDEEIFSSYSRAVVGDVEDTEREYGMSVCDTWNAADAGGHGITVDTWDISAIPTGATFEMQFDALLQPDRYLIEYPVGTLVHDTGWRGSATYEGNPRFPGGIAGPGQGSEPNVFTKGASDTFRVTTIGGEPGTIWYYDFRCSAN